jgi:hypothetical protein
MSENSLTLEDIEWLDSYAFTDDDFELFNVALREDLIKD